jgi:ParB family chromosome partitioning protein
MPQQLFKPQLVDVTAIRESPYQPRKVYDQSALEDLAQDIAEHGIQQPPHVRPLKGHYPVLYELVFGHRRWMAAKAAGFAQIPVVVRRELEHDELGAFHLTYKENADIEPLSDYDEARAFFAFKAMIEKKEGREISQTQFLRRIRRAPEYWAKRAKVVDLPDDLAAIAQKHRGVMTQLIEINETTGELREKLIHGFDDNRRLSVAQVRQTIEAHKAARKYQQDSYTAPDTQTQSRQSHAAQKGSAPISRGRELVTHNKSECSAHAKGAIAMAQNNLETARQWMERGGNAPKGELWKLKRQIEELLGE